MSQPMALALNIIDRPPQDLMPASRNARTHSEAQIAQLMGSIRQFGFTNPVLLDGEGGILAGHGRVEAAKRLGLASVPTIDLAHLTANQRRAYILADNKLALNAGWDEELLRLELGELADLDLGFDLDVIGFSTIELDVMETKAAKPRVDKDDEVPEAGRHAISEPGDLWILGEHRLLCGDSRDPASFARLMGEERARMVFSDPPYNVPIGGHVGGLGAVKHAEFAMASGEMSQAEFVTFLRTVFENAAAVSLDGAIHFQCMDWRHAPEMEAAGRAVYSELKNLCVWAKDNAGMGSLYRSHHELVYVWKVGGGAHINNVELGKHGRYRTNVWTYPGATKTGTEAELAWHPTVKPVVMIVDAIKDVSRRGDIVLDAFGGSGSTLIAAQRCGRRARLIEYEGRYCDVTIGRWERRAKAQAILEATGESFQEVTRRRADEIERRADAALELEDANHD